MGKPDGVPRCFLPFYIPILESFIGTSLIDRDYQDAGRESDLRTYSGPHCGAQKAGIRSTKIQHVVSTCSASH